MLIFFQKKIRWKLQNLQLSQAAKNSLLKIPKNWFQIPTECKLLYSKVHSDQGG